MTASGTVREVSEVAFVPTHIVHTGGLQSYADGTGCAPAVLSKGVEVRVTEQRDSWAHVVVANGWSSWVESSGLAAIPPKPVSADAATLAAMTAALDAYQHLLDEYSAGRADRAAVQQGALRAGLIVRHDAAWIFDFAHSRWLRYDGFGLRAMESPDG